MAGFLDTTGAGLYGTGRIDWRVQRDNEGHREYRIRWRIRGEFADGPTVIMQTAGLPAVGSTWAFGNDLDSWAMCHPDLTVQPQIQNEKGHYWLVEQKFSTRPFVRCQDIPVDDPLLEPQRISGSFIKFTKEVVQNYDGTYIKSSSHEQLRGPHVEFDANRPSVVIEQNVALLGLEDFTPLVDTVNDDTMWGLPARTIKLSNVAWSRQVFGVCGYYYTRRFEFDINYNTFDREVLDEGTRVLFGQWNYTSGEWEVGEINGNPANANNPNHFIRYKDLVDENNPRVILDGAGKPWDGDGDPGTVLIEYYPQNNFSLLGIPTTL